MILASFLISFFYRYFRIIPISVPRPSSSTGLWSPLPSSIGTLHLSACCRRVMMGWKKLKRKKFMISQHHNMVGSAKLTGLFFTRLVFLTCVIDHLHKDTPNSVVSKYGGSTLNLAGALCIWRENFEEFG